MVDRQLFKEKVRIKSKGRLFQTFPTQFPSQLRGLIKEDEFDNFINNCNRLMKKSYKQTLIYFFLNIFPCTLGICVISTVIALAVYFQSIGIGLGGTSGAVLFFGLWSFFCCHMTKGIFGAISEMRQVVRNFDELIRFQTKDRVTLELREKGGLIEKYALRFTIHPPKEERVVNQKKEITKKPSTDHSQPALKPYNVDIEEDIEIPAATDTMYDSTFPTKSEKHVEPTAPQYQQENEEFKEESQIGSKVQIEIGSNVQIGSNVEFGSNVQIISN